MGARWEKGEVRRKGMPSGKVPAGVDSVFLSFMREIFLLLAATTNYYYLLETANSRVRK